VEKQVQKTTNQIAILTTWWIQRRLCPIRRRHKRTSSRLLSRQDHFHGAAVTL